MSEADKARFDDKPLGVQGEFKRPGISNRKEGCSTWRATGDLSLVAGGESKGRQPVIMGHCLDFALNSRRFDICDATPENLFIRQFHDVQNLRGHKNTL